MPGPRIWRTDAFTADLLNFHQICYPLNFHQICYPLNFHQICYPLNFHQICYPRTMRWRMTTCW